MERLTPGWWGTKWTGQAVLISPAHSALDELLLELERQSTKKNVSPIRWSRHTASEDERNELFKELGICESREGDYTENIQDDIGENPKEILARAHRFAKLRGLSGTPKDVVVHFAESSVHASRAYGHSAANRIATTIHGAKNCEFDNVFVLWPYGVTGTAERQRRLLYNAITRAKQNCIVLDLRKKDTVESDEVIRLLGNPKPAFPKKEKHHTTAN